MKPIEVEDLTKYYGDFCAVDHIDFDVGAGEFFGFLGPNGAGKTTTIRMMTGLSTPSKGTVRIMGFDISKDPFEAKERFGVVPEASNIYEDLTAWENLSFAGELYGISRSERRRRAEELLDAFDLSEFKDKKVKGFSKGMRRKVTLSMAMIHSPDILFLDEPTSGLDPISAGDFDALIMALQETLGLTVFMVTHDLDSLYTACDRIIALADGKVIAEGPIETMLEAEHPWLRAYFHGARAQSRSGAEA